MGISLRPSYQLPNAGEIPESVVHWKVEPKRAVLLIHDMQQYFVDPFSSDRNLRDTLVGNISWLAYECATAGVPAVYTAQPGDMTSEQRGLLRDFWGDGMSSSAAHKSIVEELAPREEDEVLTKWRYSAFHETGLLEYLRSAGRDQLLICGVYAHVGCLMTANDALAHDIQSFLIADAVADFSWEYHNMALTYAGMRCSAIPSTADVASSLVCTENPSS